MTVPSDSRDWFQKLVAPRSVAVVGASDNAERLTGRVQVYLGQHRYEGTVYPVNPNRPAVQGLRAFPSVQAIGSPVDVAVLTVPAHSTADAVRDCAAAGVDVAVLCSAGFSEIGDVGAALEAELRAVGAEAGVRLIGPNGIGVVSARSRFTGTFMTALETDRFELHDDGIALVTQSGAVGSYLLSLAQDSGLGLGTIVSIGNEVDVAFSELVSRFVDDDGTRTILGYIEGLRDGPAFVRAARAARDAGKPVAVLKVGTTELGARAATSHTASLVGVDRVYDGVLHQLGVIRAESLQHLLDVGRLLAFEGDQIGRRVTVATVSGGTGIIATDRAVQRGLTLAEWDAAWRGRLAELLPPYVSTVNPIDMSPHPLSDVDSLVRVLGVMDEHPATDVVMVILGNAERQERLIARHVAEAARRLTKPLIVVWVGGAGAAERQLGSDGVVCFNDPTRAMDALAAVAIRRPRTTPVPLHRGAAVGEPARIVADGVEGRWPMLDEVRSKRLLACYGVPVVREHVVADPAGVGEAVAAVGLPAVAKLRSRHLAHKSEIDGVRLDLRSTEEVADAVADLLTSADALDVADADVVVAEQVDVGLELLVAARRDPTFDAVVTVGMGGLLTEAFDDVEVLLSDFGPGDVEAAVARLAHHRLLEGPRGIPPVPLEQVATALRSLGQLVADFADHIAEVEVNPLVVARPDGRLVAVDALVVMRAASRS